MKWFEDIWLEQIQWVFGGWRGKILQKLSLHPGLYVRMLQRLNLNKIWQTVTLFTEASDTKWPRGIRSRFFFISNLLLCLHQRTYIPNIQNPSMLLRQHESSHDEKQLQGSTVGQELGGLVSTLWISVGPRSHGFLCSAFPEGSMGTVGRNQSNRSRSKTCELEDERERPHSLVHSQSFLKVVSNHQN